MINFKVKKLILFQSGLTVTILQTVLIKYMIVRRRRIGVSTSTILANTMHPYINERGNQMKVPTMFANIQANFYGVPLSLKF